MLLPELRLMVSWWIRMASPRHSRSRRSCSWTRRKWGKLREGRSGLGFLWGLVDELRGTVPMQSNTVSVDPTTVTVTVGATTVTVAYTVSVQPLLTPSVSGPSARVFQLADSPSGSSCKHGISTVAILQVQFI
jgi:hypothetical protein